MYLRNIIVTGGAGFIGSHLVEALCCDRGHQVTIIDNLRRGRLSNLEACRDRVSFIQGDIRDRNLLASAMRGIDVVYHLAAQSNVLGAVADLDYSFTTNVAGTLEVLQAAVQAGVRRVVFTSSREVYGDAATLPVKETSALLPKNAYGASKAAAEMYCNALSGSELGVTILRLANVYGSRDFDRVIPIFLSQALQDLPLTIFGGDQVIDFVPVESVVEALIKAGNSDPSSPINVGTGLATTVRSLAQRIIADTRSSSEVHLEPARDVEVSRFVASTDKMKSTLGIEPPDDPLCKLDDLIEWTARRRTA